MRRVVLLLLAAASAADDVENELLRRDVGAWARELEAELLPRDSRALRVRFDVLLRAGHLGHLAEVIDALANEPDMGGHVDALVGRGCLDLARRALERFAHVHRDAIDRYVHACGDAIDEEWLAARAAGNDVFFEPWFSLRVRRGTAGALLEKLAEGVRGQPEDVRAARRYLWARHEAKAADDLSWLRDVLRPRLSTGSAEIGDWLSGPHPDLAVFFLERSLAQPFTEEDERLSTLRLAMMPRGSIEAWFRDNTRASLARAYQRCGEAQKAQAVIEDLARRYPDGLPPGVSGLAGQVQLDSGARVVEGGIRGKEPERKDDAAYWHARAEYFAGRKEDAEARAAFEKALSLAPPSHDKSRILDSFARYLASTGCEPEAQGLRDRAFTEAEPGSDYAYSVLTRLLHGGWHPGTEDERPWRHLAARTVWHDEKELLFRMARLPERRPEVWRRATELAKDADPSRAVMLADAMIGHGDGKGAIPLLRGALPRLAAGYPAYHARSLLFDALLREKDFGAAEELVAAEDGAASRLGRIAVAAARAGEEREALRLWVKRTNLDRLSPDGLDAMIAAVGADAVAACYDAIASLDRRFRVPRSLAAWLTPEAGTPPRPGSGPRR